MPKEKSAVQPPMPDRTGKLVPVEDHRSDSTAWPIEFKVPQEQADDWLAYLEAECSERNWGLRGTGQALADENSGSLTIDAEISGQAVELAVKWERPRGGPILVRARLSGPSQSSLNEVSAFFQRVNERCQGRAKEQYHKRGQLHYWGLPWRGELWLNDRLRLGPPSKHAPFPVGPQVIIVDATIRAIGRHDAGAVFDKALRELSVFLSVVLCKDVRVPEIEHAWTWKTLPDGRVECEVRQLGYWQADNPSAMPVKGEFPGVLLKPTNRPDPDWPGTHTSDGEQCVPEDILDLWAAYSGLSPEKRQQFQQAGHAWQVALALPWIHETASLAFMVVACEALKPPGKKYDKRNLYDVICALPGKTHAKQLQKLRFPPQNVRNQHLHRGELIGSELVQRCMMSSFHDPSFNETRRTLGVITHAAIVRWLELRGAFELP